MSDLPSLLLDIGNSSVKYTLFHPSFATESFKVERSRLHELSQLKLEISSIFFSSVLDDTSNLFVIKLAEQLKVPLFQCKSRDSQFGILNAYTNPGNMGDDRWMAIIAAVSLSGKQEKRDVLVIDSGSAITCDFIIADNHIGGWIAPGIKMLRDTVVSHTKRVFDKEQSMDLLTLGKDTPQCVFNGALAQVSGMAKQAISLMQQRSNDFQVFVSGGDAENIIRVIKQTTLKTQDYSLHHVENLVIVGLARIARKKLL